MPNLPTGVSYTESQVWYHFPRWWQVDNIGSFLILESNVLFCSYWNRHLLWTKIWLPYIDCLCQSYTIHRITKWLIHHYIIPHSIASDQQTQFTVNTGWQWAHAHGKLCVFNALPVLKFHPSQYCSSHNNLHSIMISSNKVFHCMISHVLNHSMLFGREGSISGSSRVCIFILIVYVLFLTSRSSSWF